MTDTEIFAGIEEYLSNHLDCSFWAEQDAKTKTALVTMAKLDVCAVVPTLQTDSLEDPSICKMRPCRSDFFLAAVAEQSLYLAHNYRNQTGDRVVQSQTVGPLSQTFKYLSDGTLSSRASVFVTRLKNCQSKILRWDRG